jgi:hypothetical protein
MSSLVRTELSMRKRARYGLRDVGTTITAKVRLVLLFLSYTYISPSVETQFLT